MAKLLNQLTIDNVNYDLYDSEFIIDNRTEGGAALTGVSHAPELFDGMQISYWLNYAAGSSATMNLTLADGTKTGAVPIYYSGTTRLTTHYAAGNVLHMTYRENAVISGTARGAGWWCDANYYSDTNYDIFGTAMDVDTAIYNYSLFAITGHNGTIAKQTNTNEAGTYWKANSFTQSGGNGTSKKATTKGYYPYKIFYNPNNTSYTTAGGNTSTVASGTSNVDLRYTVNGTTSANIGATGAPFFLVGTIKSDGLFYLKGDQATKEWWTAGIPTTKNTDYVYWFVGMMSSAYQVRLSDRNWFLKWTGTGDNDHLIQFEPWFTVEHADSADSVPWSGVTGKPDTFTPTIGTTSTTAAAGNHTHGYIANNGSIPAAVAANPASGDKIVITDSSDSDKVKGSITIGSDDGKFLRHDGSWGETPVEVFNITATIGGASSFPTDVSYADFTAAIAAKKIIQVSIPSLQMSGILSGRSRSQYLFNVQHALFTGGEPAIFVFEAENSPDDSLVFRISNVYYSVSADFPRDLPDSDGSYVLGMSSSTGSWKLINIPFVAPSNDGNYSLNVSDGTTSWTTASSGPDTPDAPIADGNYVLNVSSGSSSWQEEEKEVVEIVFDSVTQATVGSITGPVLYSSTTTYTKSLALCQDKIVKLRIPGTLIDAMTGSQGSGDVVDLVTSAGLPDNGHFAISYDTSVRVTDTGLVNGYVHGEVPIYSLDGTVTGACCVPVLRLMLRQARFMTIADTTGLTTDINVPTLSLNQGLLYFEYQTISVVSGDSTCSILAFPD